MAHPKHQDVRQRYRYRCGYCGVSETDSGGELTVDHYKPISAGGDDSEENLVYACIRCNLYKGDYWPDGEDSASNLRVLHPLQDDYKMHLKENAHFLLEGLTETGRFHIQALELNRLPLIAHRRAKKEAAQQAEQNRWLLTFVRMQESTMESMEDYLRVLKQRLQLLQTEKQNEDSKPLE